MSAAFHALGPQIGVAAACAVLQVNRSGVYRERVRLHGPSRPVPGLRPRPPLSLTPAEQDWVRGPAAEDPRLGHDAAANLVWSAKESALKVLRVGLRADTRSVEITVRSDLLVDGWAPFTAALDTGPVLHGWWRRDGVYLLTVSAQGPLDPPSALPGAADLAVATPVHSWVGSPLVRPGE